MWGSSAAPPPPPPPPPTAATTHPPPYSGWRRQQGRDYWVKAFQSLGDGHLPAATSTTAAASSPRFSSTRADRELKEHEEVSKDTSTMDTSNNTKLSTIYYQTRNTRRARNTTTLHNIDNSTMQQIHNTHIGSFDTEHKINSNFIASRNDSTKHM